MKTLNEMKAQFADRLNVDIPCACGRTHRADVEYALIGEGAVSFIPELLREHGYDKVLVLSDEYTWAAAGEQVTALVNEAGFTVYSHIYDRGGETLIADEQAMDEGAEAFLSCPERPDVIIAVGTGTLNDLGKEISARAGVRSWNVGTAPSMDGFASTVAALVRDNLKVTEYYTPPEVIIGDTKILKNCPREMVLAGIADMAAKYNARLDWRISRIVNDEYYCDFIADGMLKVTDDIMDLALEVPEDGTFSDALIERLMEGLIMSGVYMSYTGTSRAASGAEHHFSHFWEMWLQVNHKPPIYHGVKVGVGSMTMAELYPKFLTYEIDPEKSRACVESFDEEKEIEELKEVFKDAAPLLLESYSFDKPARLERIDKEVSKRDQINAEIEAMLPRLEKMKQALHHIGARTRWDELDNISEKEAREALLYCKSMRPNFTLLQMLQDTAYPLETFEEGWLHPDHTSTTEEGEETMADPEIKEEVKEEVKEEQTETATPSKRRGRPKKTESAASAAPAKKHAAAEKKTETPAKKKKKEELPYYLL